FSVAPMSAGRSWKMGCAESRKSDAAATCGKAFVDPAPLPDGGEPPWDAGDVDPSSGGGWPEPRDPGPSTDHQAAPDGLGCAARLSARGETPTSLPLLALACAAIALRRRRSR